MSTAKFDTLQNAAGSKSVPVSTVVDGSAKAWVNFNGTGTVAIRASFNCTSITDNGLGLYTVNFTTALQDSNYAVAGMARRGATNSDMGITLPFGGTYTESAVRVAAKVYTTNTEFADADIVTVAVFR